MKTRLYFGFWIGIVIILFQAVLSKQKLEQHEQVKKGFIPHEMLDKWINRCFSVCPEFGSQTGNFNHKGLEKETFENSLNAYAKSMQQDKEMGDKSLWLDKKLPEKSFFHLQKRHNEHVHPYVMKKEIPTDSEIIFIGDVHGSLHALMRTLSRLVVLGYLDNNFRLIRTNTYIVFLGDYVDRGSYGVECLFTLWQLKLANWNNVMLLRGNHEEWDCVCRFGFLDELEKKFGSIYENELKQFFGFLPYAIFLKIKGTDNIIQCCHGGIQEGYSPAKLINSPQKFEKVFNYQGFNWSDFQCGNNTNFYDNWSRRAGVIAETAAAQKYLDKTGIKAIFRAHQDMGDCFKMFPRGNVEVVKEKVDPNFLYMYPDGPFPWKSVVSVGDQIKNENEGFFLSGYFPIFTLTNAAEARSLLRDSFVKLKIAPHYENWQLKVYESDIESCSQRNGKFVSLELQDDLTIVPSWKKQSRRESMCKKLENFFYVIPISQNATPVNN
jgi:hypothetical protein